MLSAATCQNKESIVSNMLEEQPISDQGVMLVRAVNC